MQKKLLSLGVILLFFQSGAWASENHLQGKSVFDENNIGKIAPTNRNTTLPIISSEKNSHSIHSVLAVPSPPMLDVHGYYLEEINSGKVLGVQNPDQKMPPASLTKLMTLYLTFEALSSHRLQLTDLVPISEKAWKTGGSRMFVKVGDRVPLSDLLNGVIVDSGNDACVALAEYIAGSQENFVDLMNQQAKLLGMNNTHYMDATGLPNPNHYTTPHDLAILSKALIQNFPQYYPLFSQKTYTFNRITQENRNELLFHDPAVDGLKTGHTDAAGYCLIASSKHGDMRLLSVMLGAPSIKAREEYSEALLNYGTHFYETHKIYSQYQAIDKMPIYFGQSHSISVGAGNDIYLTIPVGQFEKVIFDHHIITPLKAPLKKYQKVGVIQAFLDNKNILDNSGNTDIVALETVGKGNIFRRIWDKLKLSFHSTP